MNSIVLYFNFLLLCVSYIKPLKANDVIFELHRGLKNSAILKKSDSFYSDLFDIQSPTQIYVHGRAAKATIEKYRKLLSKPDDSNVIIVRWNNGSDAINYLNGKVLVDDVTIQLAELIDRLFAQGMSLRAVNIIGHGLGAHIISGAAKKIKTADKIGTIIALDPILMGFEFSDEKNRLTRSDAHYVEVIHTDGTKFGILETIGHADYYPNYGLSQPGCSGGFSIFSYEYCSHYRANELFWSTLSTTFPAIKCASHAEIKLNQCTFNNVTGSMGGIVNSNTTKPHGVFYLETTSKPPFVISNYKSFKNIKIIPGEHFENEEKLDNEENMDEIECEKENSQEPHQNREQPEQEQNNKQDQEQERERDQLILEKEQVEQEQIEDHHHENEQISKKIVETIVSFMKFIWLHLFLICAFISDFFG